MQSNISIENLASKVRCAIQANYTLLRLNIYKKISYLINNFNTDYMLKHYFGFIRLDKMYY